MLSKNVFLFVATALFTVSLLTPVVAQNFGDGSIAMWKGDSTAAATFSIDDNQKPDHAWWTAAALQYDFSPTWFVITDRIGTNFGGSWGDFATLQSKGHDIQSHTVDHFPNFPDGNPLTLQQNYGDSITAIESNVTGSKVTTLAYPFGLQAPNDKSIAQQYYVGARGVSGVLNKASSIDYMNVNSLSTDGYAGGFAIPGGSLPTTHWAYAPNLVTAGHQHHQGLLSVHTHSLNADKKAALTDLLDYLTETPGDFWIGSFSSVIQYGQERDDAQLTTQIIDNDEISFDLTDSLDDGNFFEALTVKIQLDTGWDNVTATQNGNSLAVTITEENGIRYALIDSIPDQGTVSVQSVQGVPEPTAAALLGLIVVGAGLIRRR